MEPNLPKYIYLSIDITTNTLQISTHMIKYYEQKSKSSESFLSYNGNLANLKGYMVYDFEILHTTIDKLLVEFVSYNFENFYEYLIFFTRHVDYFINQLDFKDMMDVIPNQRLEIEYITDLAKKSYENNKNKLIKVQNDYIKAIDFIFNINEETKLKKLTPKQRYFLYERYNDSLDKYSNDFKTSQTLGFTYTDLKQQEYQTLNDMIKTLKQYDSDGSKIYSSNGYITDDIYTVFYILLYHVVLQNKLNIKKCKNCDKYFATTKANIVYCDRLFTDDRTCKDIGNSISQKRKESHDEVYKLYRNTLAKKKMAAIRNPDIPKYTNDYETWKTQANKFRNEIAHGKKTDEEFNEWIERTR